MASSSPEKVEAAYDAAWTAWRSENLRVNLPTKLFRAGWAAGTRHVIGALVVGATPEEHCCLCGRVCTDTGATKAT